MNRIRIALIPAYQPGDALPELLRSLHREGTKIIVVDDGSGDGYSQVFRDAEHYATVLRHGHKMGKGQALKTGLSYLRNHRGTPCVIVTADANGQHRIDDIRRVMEAAVAHPESLILGSRQLGKGTPLRSKMGNTLTRWVYRFSTGSGVHDTQTGLRGFTELMILRLLEIPGSRYEYEMNVLMDFSKNKIPILEVPIETVYLDNNSASHFDTVKDSCRIYREILKFSASSLISFFVDYCMFCSFSAIGLGVAAANVAARVISASVNYTLNMRLVFSHRGQTVRSAASYFLLAGGLLILNTGILRLLTYAGINQYAAKIMTELLLFLLSYTAQHAVIFRKKGAKQA